MKVVFSLANFFPAEKIIMNNNNNGNPTNSGKFQSLYFDQNTVGSTLEWTSIHRVVKISQFVLKAGLATQTAPPTLTHSPIMSHCALPAHLT